MPLLDYSLYATLLWYTVRFIIYNTDVSERMSGKRSFFNMAPARFKPGTR